MIQRNPPHDEVSEEHSKVEHRVPFQSVVPPSELIKPDVKRRSGAVSSRLRSRTDINYTEED